jgi:diacylglycerol kinase (ATP)
VVAVEGVSVGFLALARAEYRAANSADVRAAVRAAAQALRHFHPLDVRLLSHGEIDIVHVGQLFVANMSSFGTGLRVAPDADPHDGRLDVVALDISGRLAIPLMLARLRRGRHLGHRGVLRWQVRRLRIETRGRSPIMADTDDLGSGPVDVAVMPGALRIVMPPPGR